MVLQMKREEAQEFAGQVDFDKLNGLIPAIIQDASDGKVLMQAYMNKEALILTLLTGKTHFWSRTRKKLWMKGEESGHFSIVQNISLDCDNDAVLVKVSQIGPICHTNEDSCFHKGIIPEQGVQPNSSVLERIYEIILERMRTESDGSYVRSLIKKGESEILRKVGEESTEVILASRDTPDTLVSEVTDLIFHLMMLLAAKGRDLTEIFKEFDRRHREKVSGK
jgi:phosphoribosyl-ATP pyrophosphohydrolase/phosphoribosyl-AMP cyclohydrolase